MANKPKLPPVLRRKRVAVTYTVDIETKRLLEKAKKTTGITIGEYIDRAVQAQCILDHVT